MEGENIKRRCHRCGNDFFGSPRQRICDQCSKQRIKENSKKQRKRNAPFVPYGEYKPPVQSRCATCGEINVIKGKDQEKTIYCKRCGMIIYVPSMRTYCLPEKKHRHP